MATFTGHGGVSLHGNLWAGRDGATPFVLVHGLSSNARLWDGVARRLAESGHPVVAIDQRGHGLSDKPDHGYETATVVADLLAVVNQIPGPPPVAAGQSWGANIALQMAADHPESVRAIACVDGGVTDMINAFPEWEDCAAKLAPPQLVGVPLERIERFFRQAHSDWPEESVAGALANFEVREDGTVAPFLTFERHMAILRGLWEHRPSLLFPDMKVPVLFAMAATTDRPEWTAAKRAAAQRAMEVVPDGRAVWFEGDHDIHGQHPGELAALLRELAS